MSVNLFYRRPAYVDQRNTPASEMSNTSSEFADSIRRSKPSPRPSGIPERLSFDRIVADGTCPPCTLRDFMNYLIYVEHAAENFQFFLWFRSYIERFDALPASEKALSPVWSFEQQKNAVYEWKIQNKARRREPSSSATNILTETLFLKEADVTTHSQTLSHERSFSHASIASQTPTIFGANCQAVTPWDSTGAARSSSGDHPTAQSNSEKSRESAEKVAYGAFDKAGLAQPFTIQPFHKEMSHVIQTYITDDSPRQLNISSRQRSTLLKALESTTHPSAFARVAEDVESTLRNQLHPNFIRWAICNGNRPRVIFARGLGVGLILIGILVELLITLSHIGRGFRALGAIGLVLGIATLIAAYKGMCVVLHGMHHRHLRPWELFTDDSRDKESFEAHILGESVDSIQSSNSYEDAPWVVRYQKRNIIRKVFDRETWIQEPALRQIQDMIFIQSMLCALLVSAVLTAIFVALPKGGFI